MAEPLHPSSDRLWPWDFAAVMAWLAWSHWQPQEVYQEWRALGLGVLLIAVLLRTPGIMRGSDAGSAPTVFLASLFALPLWGWIVSRLGVNPSAGVVVVGTWLQGALIATWAVLLAVARRDRAEALVRVTLIGLGALACALTLAAVWKAWVIAPRLTAALEEQWLGGDPHALALLGALVDGRLRGTLGDPNHIGLIAAVGAVALAGGAVWARSWATRLIAAAGGFVALAGLLMSGSRGGLLSLLGGAVVLAWGAAGRRDHRRRRRLVTALAWAAVVGVLCLALVPGVRERLANSSTIRERLGYWGIALELFVRSPFLGEGVGGFEIWYPSLRSVGFGTARFAHNLPLQLLAETGVVGLVLALLPFAFLAALIARHPARSRIHGTMVPVLAVLAVFGLNSLTQHSILFREMWLDASLVLGLAMGWLLVSGEPDRGVPRVGATAAALILALGASVLVGWGDVRRARAELTSMAASAVLEQGDVAESLSLTQRATEIEPRWDWLRVDCANRLMSIAEATGSDTERPLGLAEEHLTVAEEVNPLRPSIQSGWARLRALRGDPAGAIAAQRAAVRLHPADWELRLGLAVHLRAHGDLPEAERVAREAVEMSRGDFRADMMLAEVLLDAGETDEALHRVRRAIETVNLPYADGQFLLSRVEHAAGRSAEALEAAEQAARIAPSRGEIIRWRSRLRLESAQGDSVD